MKERWKDITNFEEFYQVSNLGRIKCKQKHVKFPDGRVRIYEEQIKKCFLKREGYIAVNLTNSNTKERKTFTVHRLVANAFIPNPLNLPQVNHKKGIKTDNRVSELEWSTISNNVIHGIQFKLFKVATQKITLDIAKQIRNEYNAGGVYQTALAKKYNLSRMQILRIINFKTWKQLK